MENLINQICDIDGQVKKNQDYLNYVLGLGKRGLANAEMLTRASKLGDVTLELVKQRAALTKILWDKYRILYVVGELK